MPIHQALIAGALCVFLAACTEEAPVLPDEPSVAVETRPNQAVPATPGTPRLKVKLLDGGDYDLTAHRGKWVVVNFWATWCGPCLKEIPELSALHTEAADIEVVGLAYEEIDEKAMRAFLAKHKASYPIAIIDTFNPPADFDTPRGLPMTVLIAPDGQVAKKVLGPVTAAAIRESITRYAATGRA